MSIERQWHGVAKHENAKHYIAHLEKDTFPKLNDLEGYMGAKVLSKTLDNGNIAFIVVTCWESMSKIESFAGSDINKAVVPEAAQALMVAYDETVTHYEVCAEHSPQTENSRAGAIR